jgi:thiol-disulfide isomerase/thioredoxin
VGIIFKKVLLKEKFVKKFIKETLFFIIIFIIATSIIGYIRSANTNENALNLLKNYKTIDNKDISMLIKNKILVLNFWGTWCPICKQEIYNISNLSKKDDFIIITIAYNSGEDKDIKEFLKQKGVNFYVVNDKDGKITKAFKISTFPTTIFYSKDRKKVIKDSGYISTAGFLARVKGVK